MSLLRFFAISSLIAAYALAVTHTYTDKNGLRHRIQDDINVGGGKQGGVDRKETTTFNKLPINTVVKGETKEAKVVYGGVEVIGASVIKVKNGGYDFNPIISGTLTASSITNVVFENEDSGYTTNSARATFDFSDIKDKKGVSIANEITGDKIIFARLFWGGRIMAYGSPKSTRDGYFNEIKDFNKIRFKTPKGIYNLTASEANTYWLGSYNPAGPASSFQYQASIDVTQLVKDSLGTTPAGRTFSAGDIKTDIGNPATTFKVYVDGTFMGVRVPRYGGWALVIVYDFGPANAQRIKPKGVSVYEGIRVLTPLNTSLGMARSLLNKFEGFFTPMKGVVGASFTSLSFGAAKEIRAEKIEIREDSSKPTYSIHDATLNKEEEQFNSTISRYGKHLNPNKKYNASMDLDTYDITGKLRNGQSKAEVQLTAQIVSTSRGPQGDEATVGMVAFSTDAYVPEVCYVEKLFYSKNNGTTFTEVSTDPSDKTVIAKNNILRTQLQITNQGNEDAQFVSVSAVLDDESANYKDNSTYVTPHSSSSSFTLGALQTDNDPAGLQTLLSGNKKGINVNIGQGATPAKGGTIKKDENAYIQYDSTLNKKFKLASYETKFENKLLKLEYDGVMSPCQGNKKYYLTIAEPGKYKVVNEKFAKKGDNENLFTQIAGKEFDVNVAFLSDSLNAGQTPTGPSEKQKVMLDVVTSCDSSGLSVLANSPKPTVELEETRGVVKIEKLLINNAYSKLFFNISVFDTDTNKWKSECGYSDAFAVRPEKFVAHQSNGTIVDTSETSPIRLVGGAPYTNTGMTAVYGSDIIATGYTQTLQTDTATKDDDKTQIVRFTPILSSACEANVPNAVVTNLKKINAKAIFSQGKGTLSNSGGTNFSYPDIGLAKVYLKDASYTAIDGAQNDCIKNSDTTTKNSDAKVGCDIRGEMFLSFAPQSIAVRNLQISNFGSSNMTYVSNDSAMSSTAKFDINALLGDGNVANLYTRSCYAQRTSFTMGIDQIIPDYTDNNGETTDASTTDATTLARNLASAISEVIFFDNDAGSDTRKIAGSAANIGSYSVNATAFADTDATARVNIRFNFARTTNLAKNPFTVSSNTFTFNNISSSNAGILAGAPGATYVKPTAVSNTTFYYGQVYAPDYIGPASGFNADVFYGIHCNACNVARYPLINAANALPQTNNWFVNTTHQNINLGTHGAFGHATTTTALAPNPIVIVNGVETISLSSRAIITDVISMNASSWLVFDPINAAAVTNRFNATFTRDNIDMTWGGRALKADQKNDGVGTVVGTQSIDGGANKLNDTVSNKPNKRLDW